MTSKLQTISDEQLTAFLDGEADPALAQRVAAAIKNEPALEARAQTLQTAVSDVEKAFDLKVLAAPSMPEILPENRAGRLSSFVMPAALAASFALGMVVMTLLQPVPDWVDQVASYQALYVEETLSGAGQDADTTTRTLGRAGAALDLEINEAPLLDGMVFKRAQMLAVGGEPLVQLAYAGEDGTPFALCITHVLEGDRKVSVALNHDLATASWVSDGRGFVLIGGTDISAIEDLARGLTDRI